MSSAVCLTLAFFLVLFSLFASTYASGIVCDQGGVLLGCVSASLIFNYVDVPKRISHHVAQVVKVTAFHNLYLFYKGSLKQWPRK